MGSLLKNIENRIHCERFNTDMSASCCIARQKLAADPDKWRLLSWDKGCLTCNQGQLILRDFGLSTRSRVTENGQKPVVKRCNCCDRLMPEDSFYFVSKKTGARKSICKECITERQRLARVLNRRVV